MQGGFADIFSLDIASEKVTNITKDDIANYAPAYAPDGKSIVYLARVSGNEKLFRIDLATGKKTQLTFGTHDDAAARFLDADTLIFPSTATDPNTPVEPDVARNGSIFNLWTLSLKNGELKQWTDALGGNFSPVVLHEGQTSRVAFVSYYKGGYELHTMDRKEALLTAASSDFGAPGPVIDFQAPLSHTLVADNKRKKRSWDKLFLDGRPSLSLGVTSGDEPVRRVGDFVRRRARRPARRRLRGRDVAIPDDGRDAHQPRAPPELRGPGLLAGRLLLRQHQRRVLRPLLQLLPRAATRRPRCAAAAGAVYGIYPFDRYRRIELSGGFGYVREQYNDSTLEQIAQDYQQSIYGSSLYRNGWYVPLSVAFVQETTVFREFGPLSGSTMRLAYEIAPKVGSKTLSWQAVDLDLRKYFKIGSSGLLAVRGRGYRSWGQNPSFTYYGGNADMRGYDYLEFVGQNSIYGNAELRLPLINAMATPIGVLGGVRGVAFFNVGGAWWNNTGFKFSTSASEVTAPVTGYDTRPDDRGRDTTRTATRSRSRDSASWAAARRTVSGWRRSPSGSPSTSTGPGGPCSTRAGKTSSSRARTAGARAGASRGCSSGSGTTSRVGRQRPAAGGVAPRVMRTPRGGMPPRGVSVC